MARISDKRLMHDDDLPNDVEHVFGMAHKPLLGKQKSSTMSTVIILRHGIISSKNSRWELPSL